MQEVGGFLFLAAILGGLWLAWRNLRSAPGALLGALLGWLIGR